MPLYGVTATDPAYQAGRVSLRSLDVGALGHYSITLRTGTMAAGIAAGSEWAQFRWTDATRLCVIEEIMFSGFATVTNFTPGILIFDAFIARAWTADGTGGTAATLTGNNQKLRTSFGTTLLGTARVATTAALGAGTKTLDTQAIGEVIGGALATGITVPIVVAHGRLFEARGNSAHPVVLAQNEGVVITATVPASGTWTTGCTIKWGEVAAF
jgi:hypothetical protein